VIEIPEAGGIGTGVVEFQDLPLADRDHEWDGSEANIRVREWAGAEDELNDRHRTAFVWYEPDDADVSKGYKFQIADVVDGKLKAVRRGIICRRRHAGRAKGRRSPAG
jgi:hypothetical protein